VLDIADDCLFAGDESDETFSTDLAVPDEAMEVPETTSSH